MNREFIRKITQRPVLDETGRLRPDITLVIENLRNSGKDPITELTKCKDYLDQRIEYMEKNPDLFYRWQLRSKKKFKKGTKASFVYMRQGVCEILSVLAVEKLDQMLNL